MAKARLSALKQGAWFKVEGAVREALARRYPIEANFHLPAYARIELFEDGERYITYPFRGSATWIPTNGVEVETVQEPLPEPYAMMAKMDRRVVSTSGWDPEIFVVDAKDAVIPAFEFLPPKTKPYNGAHVAAYWDGFQAEFNTSTPQTCHGYGCDHIREGLQIVLKEARRMNDKAKLSLKNFFRIPAPILRSADEAHVAFGCDPSTNAYGLDPVFFEDPRLVPYRSAGGHIHFGGMEVIGLMKSEKRNDVVKVLDRFVGLPCVALFDGIDDHRRRQLYGRAGEYRIPPHGIEYRVLSNAWLAHPAIMHLVMNTARAAMSLRGWDPGSTLTDAEVREIIDNCDGHRARKWVEDNWTMFSAVIAHDIGDMVDADASKRMWLGGIANELKDFADIEGNWRLNGEWMRHTHGSRLTWHTYAKDNYGI